MNAFRKLLILATALGLIPPALGIEVRNTAGQTMDVEVLAFTKSSGNVRIKRISDDQIFNVKIDLFDAPSRKAIEEAAPVRMPDLEIEVSVGRRRAREGDSSYMKRQEITVTLKAENDSRDIDLPKTRFTVLLIARKMLRYNNPDADTAKVLLKESFEKALEPGAELEFECPSVITSYDSDRDTSNIGGWEYDGYLLVLQDGEGKIIRGYSNIGPIEVLTLKDPKLLEKALGLEVGREVQRNLLPLSGPGSGAR